LVGSEIKTSQTTKSNVSNTSQQTNRPTVDEKVPLQKINILSADGRKVYQGGRQLSQYEVRQIMSNTNALQQYNIGISKNKRGNIWLWAGIGINALAFVDWGMGEDGSIVGGMILIGCGSLATGIIIKSNSKKYVENAVNLYNRGTSKTTGMEIKAGFTGNGIGLTFTF